MEKKFAEVSWNIHDLQILRPEWTEQQCMEWLGQNEQTIQDRMVETGWEVIETILN